MLSFRLDNKDVVFVRVHSWLYCVPLWDICVLYTHIILYCARDESLYLSSVVKPEHNRLWKVTSTRWTGKCVICFKLHYDVISLHTVTGTVLCICTTHYRDREQGGRESVCVCV